MGPDKDKLDSYYISKFLLEKFRDNEVKFDEVFDLDQMAKGFAASDVLDGWHGINWTNLSFYFNPVTNKFEPIFQDWYNEGFISKKMTILEVSEYLIYITMEIFMKNI